MYTSKQAPLQLIPVSMLTLHTKTPLLVENMKEASRHAGIQLPYSFFRLEMPEKTCS